MKITDKNNPTFAEHLQQIPFLVRFIFTTLTLTYIINWVSGEWIANNLTLSIERMVTNYQVWRMATFWVYEPSLSTLVIMLINSR